MTSVGRVRMEDVARVARVKVAKVSKVVNRRCGVAPSIMANVTGVIEELGYEASLGARSLRSHRTNVIGVLVAEFEPFSTEPLGGELGLRMLVELLAGREPTPAHVRLPTRMVERASTGPVPAP